MNIDLRRPNLREVPPNTRVITANTIWELVSRIDDRETWKDLKTGTLWHTPESGNYSHTQAIEKFGDKLPTREEFITAEEHGIREILELRRKWVWSSSVYPDDAGIDLLDLGCFRFDEKKIAISFNPDFKWREE